MKNHPKAISKLAPLALVAVMISGCETIDEFRDHYTNTTTDELTRELNANMRALIPTWTPVDVGPHNEKAEHGSCAGLDTTLSKRPGPPWVIALSTSVNSPTDEQWRQWNTALDSLQSRGYRTTSLSTSTGARTPFDGPARMVQDPRGYQIRIRISTWQGGRAADLETLSPCVRYKGDENAKAY